MPLKYLLSKHHCAAQPAEKQLTASSYLRDKLHLVFFPNSAAAPGSRTPCPGGNTLRLSVLSLPLSYRTSQRPFCQGGKKQGEQSGAECSPTAANIIRVIILSLCPSAWPQSQNVRGSRISRDQVQLPLRSLPNQTILWLASALKPNPNFINPYLFSSLWISLV